MKKDKMILLVKRLPTEGLYELFELLVQEINSRKNARKPLLKIIQEEINFDNCGNL